MVNGNGDINKVFEKLEEHGEDIRELQVSTKRQGDELHYIRQQIDSLIQGMGQSEGRDDYISMLVKIALGALSSLNIALIVICVKLVLL